MSIFLAFVLNFFSGYGQTFFISIFAPLWQVDFDISKVTFGWMYSFVTLSSSALLMKYGSIVDKQPLRLLCTVVFIALGMALIGLSFSQYWFLLLVGLFAIRFLGQGALPHIAASLVVKKQPKNRQGLSLGFSSLGHPAGQFLWPVLAFGVITRKDWRASFWLFAVVAFGMAGLFGFMHSKFYPTILAKPKRLPSAIKNKFLQLPWDNWQQSGGIIFILNLIAVPFFGTALLLNMDSIGMEHGWPHVWLAWGMMAFSIANAVGMLVGGWLVDVFTAKRMMHLYLLPYALAFLLGGLFSQLWVGVVFMALAGFSTGVASPVKTSALAVQFGVEKIGLARGFFGALGVLGTAISPPIYAATVQAGVGVHIWMPASAFFLLLITVIPLVKVLYLQHD